jgi:hypothetical protein
MSKPVVTVRYLGEFKWQLYNPQNEPLTSIVIYDKIVDVVDWVEGWVSSYLVAPDYVIERGNFDEEVERDFCNSSRN